MQTIGPAAPRHQAAGKLVHDDDFAVLHHVLDIAPVKGMGFDRGIDVVLEVPVLGVGDIPDAQKLLDFFPARVGDGDALVFLIHHVVAGEFAGFAGRGVHFLAFFQLGDDAIHPGVLVGGLFAGAGNDQRSAGFVDQDRIHFIDDGEVVLALHAIMNIKLHVVAQIVEAELVVGAVGDVRGVSFAALFVVQIVHDDAHGQAEEAIELAHPLGIAFGQVVVDGNHMHAAPAQSVQIDGQGGDQGFSFTGLHFGDLALVQHHAADQLHVEVPHLEHPPAGFADHAKASTRISSRASLIALVRSSSSAFRRSWSASGSSGRLARRS